MATHVKKDSSLPGTLFDLVVLGLALWAVYGFYQGYQWWTDYRTRDIPGASCVRELDADCALAAMNEANGPTGTTTYHYSEQAGRWLWTLRLLKTEGTLDSRLDQMMVTTRPYIPEDKSVPSFSFPPLLQVTTVLKNIVGGEAGTKFHDAALAKQEALGGRIGYKEAEKQYGVQTWGPLMRCWSASDKADIQARTAYSELLLTEEISHPCMLVYFADKDDATLKYFIERNLDAMQEERLKYGQAWYARGSKHMPIALYEDNVAFMAAIIAYRERGGFGL